MNPGATTSPAASMVVPAGGTYSFPDLIALDGSFDVVAQGKPDNTTQCVVENGKAKPFDQVVTDTPIGSGPYKIGPVRFGKDITYVRDPDYWGRDLPVRVGTANFDRISVKIYRDNTAMLFGDARSSVQKLLAALREKSA